MEDWLLVIDTEDALTHEVRLLKPSKKNARCHGFFKLTCKRKKGCCPLSSG